MGATSASFLAAWFTSAQTLGDCHGCVASAASRLAKLVAPPPWRRRAEPRPPEDCGRRRGRGSHQLSLYCLCAVELMSVNGDGRCAYVHSRYGAGETGETGRDRKAQSA